MNRDQFFGGNPAGVLLRLALLSVVVGIVLTTLQITPDNIVDRLTTIVRNLYEMGHGTLGWLLRHFLIGALVVFPIWFVARLLGLFRRRSGEPKS